MIDYYEVREIMLGVCKAKLASLPARKIREFSIKFSDLDQGGEQRGRGNESLLDDVEAFLIEIERASSREREC
jgi:competence protein ComGF